MGRYRGMAIRKAESSSASTKIAQSEYDIHHKRNSTTDSTEYRSSELLKDHGVYLFNSPITQESVGDAIEYILELNADRDIDWKKITMFINSSGGFVTDGFALIDIMYGSRIPIHTVGIGMIASMGLQIFLAGHKGTRTLTTNCMILSHQFSGEESGKQHELIAARDEVDQIGEMIMRHYVRTTGLSEEEVKKYLLPPQDIWLTADRAKELGVCDIVKDLKPGHLVESVKAAKRTRQRKPTTKSKRITR